MYLLVGVIVVALVLAAVLLVRRGRRVEAVTVTAQETDATAVDAPANTVNGNETRVGGRAAAVARAYQEGEIDTEMLDKAARKIGISREEAERRLGVAASGGAQSSRSTLSDRERANRKKKNKQAKQARKANR